MNPVRPAILLFMFAAVVSPVAISLHVEPLLIYNPSPSVPEGFYVRLARAPQTGDFVTIASVEVAADYAALRRFADPTDRFIKRIAAASGQTVCAEGDSVSIDGRLAAVRSSRRLRRALAACMVRLSHARNGRGLPAWRYGRFFRRPLLGSDTSPEHQRRVDPFLIHRPSSAHLTDVSRRQH